MPPQASSSSSSSPSSSSGMSAIFQKFETLKYKFSHDDEPWEYTEEPHSSRRREILAKHPEIKQLMGYDPSITYIVLTEIFIQLVMCWLVKGLSWGPLLVVAYVVGGTLNHSLGSAIHEIGHNLAYGHGHPLRNRVLGMLVNLPMGIPLSVTYKKYHSDHHRYLGHVDLDADVPLRIECFLFRWPLTRILWLIIHPVIHGIRPYIKKPYPPNSLEIVNLCVQLTFDALIFTVFGPRALIYCVAGTLFGLGLHPLAGHFISEHYMFNKGQATLSYYGPLNPILFNVGYHVEHHDFPYVPWTRLPEVRRLAPEFYDNLPHHTSWLRVLWDFVFDKDMGPQGHGVGYRKADIDDVRRKAGIDDVSRKADTDDVRRKAVNGLHAAANGHGPSADGHCSSSQNGVTTRGQAPVEEGGKVKAH